MSDALSRYRSLERKLIHTRWIQGGYESDAEDALLEDMDAVWWELSDHQRARIDGEPPKSLIRPIRAKGQRLCKDVDALGVLGGPARLGDVA